MPIYEYECHRGHKVDVIQDMNGQTPICEICGAKMERLVSAPARIKVINNAGWLNRIHEIHKRQADKGEKLRLPHPKEVRAS